MLFLLRVLAEKVLEPAVQKALIARAYLGLFIGVAPGRAQVCEISFELSIELLIVKYLLNVHVSSYFLCDIVESHSISERFGCLEC